MNARGQTGVLFFKHTLKGSSTVDEREQEGNPVMRASEVCKLLGVGRNTLYDGCRRGIIPHRRFGRVILFYRKRILAWLENRDNEGGDQ